MSYKIRIYRVPEINGSLQAFKVYVDGKEHTRIEGIDQTVTLELEAGPHEIQVKMWPNYYRTDPIHVDGNSDDDEPLYFTGFTGKMGFGSLMRNELKLLPEAAFRSVVKPNTPWPELSVLNIFLVLLISLITGGYMIYVSQVQVLDGDDSFLVLILGLGTAIGGFSAYYFNRSKTNSPFAYNKPMFDAGALLMLMFLLHMWSTEWYISGALIIGAVRFWFYLRMTKKE